MHVYVCGCAIAFQMLLSRRQMQAGASMSDQFDVSMFVGSGHQRLASWSPHQTCTHQTGLKLTRHGPDFNVDFLLAPDRYLEACISLAPVPKPVKLEVWPDPY